MKSSTFITALLLEAGLATAKPFLLNGMVYNAPAHAARDVPRPPPQSITPPSSPGIPHWVLSCIFSYDPDPNSVQAVTQQAPDFDINDYCTSFLGSTTTITKTIRTTKVVTVSATKTAASTKTITVSLGNGAPAATVSAFCPIASTGATCGFKGWGYATNNIYAGQPIDGPTCHQLCLQKSNCASFQVQDATEPSPQCNLYNVTAGGNNTISGASSPFTFYDRDCPDLSPAGCAQTTKAPTLPDLAVRDSADTAPWWLLQFDTDTISEICTCAITSAPALSTVTRTLSNGAATTTVGATVTITQAYTVTNSVGAAGGGTTTVLSSIH